MHAQRELIGPLLRDVSRSFYLTLRVLPREIRPQVSLAYLLARASDTIADTKAVAKAERIQRLHQLLANITLVCGSPDTNVGAPTSPAEARLLQRLPDCLRFLGELPDADRQRIGGLLDTIIAGQIFDLERFPGETEKDLVALKDDELDRYTYLVAGCVGEFWTRMCRAHFKELEFWRDVEMEELGVRFGKGLQLVNVLRDIPTDLRIGRCYLPVKEPQLLLDPQNFASVQSLYDRWLDTAVAHLDAGWQYTMLIPSSLWRLRLACIWPIWIGLKTIARLREANPLDPAQRIKVSRIEVYGLMLESFLLRLNDAALDERYRKLRRTAIP
ncbi:MAG: phytoene/squalene synthase family protein [Verrucomicrobiia bacterium]